MCWRRKRRAWPKWWDLQQRRDERAGLSVPENVPADARQRSQALTKELKSLADEQATRTHEIEQVVQRLATLLERP